MEIQGGDFLLSHFIVWRYCTQLAHTHPVAAHRPFPSPSHLSAITSHHISQLVRLPQSPLPTAHCPLPTPPCQSEAIPKSHSQHPNTNMHQHAPTPPQPTAGTPMANTRRPPPRNLTVLH